MNKGQRIDHWVAKGVGILCALLGGTILVQLPSVYKEEVEFHSKAISATGTVVRTKEESRLYTNGTSTNVFTDYISTVKFQANQAESVEFTTSGACSSRRDCENKRVPVLYNPNLPSDARVDSGSTPLGKLKGNLLFSVVLLLGGVALAVLEPTDGNQWNKNLH